MVKLLTAFVALVFLPSFSECADIENGVYIINQKREGKVVCLTNGQQVSVGEKVCDILGNATVTSLVNDNSLCSFQSFAGPFTVESRNKSLAICVDGVFAKVESTSPRGNNSFLATRIEGETNATKIANTLKIVPSLRRHPGHKIAVRWTTSKASYQPLESVRLQLIITNVGTTPILFSDKTRDGRRMNQFAFIAYRQRYKNSALPDTGDPDDSGLFLSRQVHLGGGERFERTIDLAPWFKFEDPDNYKVTCLYRMDLEDNEGRIVWDEFAVGECDVDIDSPK